MSIPKSVSFTLLISTILVGCNSQQQSPSTVVVDLNAVISATGQAEAIRQQIEQTDQELNAQLVQMAENLDKQLADEKAKLGDAPTEEQQQQFNAMTIQANQQLQQAQQIAQQQSQQNRLLLGQELRQQIKPIAESVAKARGASVVIETTETLMWFDPQVDITDEVIAEFRSRPADTGETKSQEQPEKPEQPAEEATGDPQQPQQ